MKRYFIIYKPYLVLSQFSALEGKQTLADFFDVPKDVYPVGRLDYDSEGLLLLTSDTKVNGLLLQPKHEHGKEYWVQVEGLVTQEAITLLQQGVSISIDGKLHMVKAAHARAFTSPPIVPERNPPIRYRKNIPASWLSLTLTQGKNRQVRRMTSKVGFPTLRLIRYRIEGLTIDGLQPGNIVELSEEQTYAALFNNRS